MMYHEIEQQHHQIIDNTGMIDLAKYERILKPATRYAISCYDDNPNAEWFEIAELSKFTDLTKNYLYDEVVKLRKSGSNNKLLFQTVYVLVDQLPTVNNDPTTRTRFLNSVDNFISGGD